MIFLEIHFLIAQCVPGSFMLRISCGDMVYIKGAQRSYDVPWCWCPESGSTGSPLLDRCSRLDLPGPNSVCEFCLGRRLGFGTAVQTTEVQLKIQECFWSSETFLLSGLLLRNLH